MAGPNIGMHASNTSSFRSSMSFPVLLSVPCRDMSSFSHCPFGQVHPGSSHPKCKVRSPFPSSGDQITVRLCCWFAWEGRIHEDHGLITFFCGMSHAILLLLNTEPKYTCIHCPFFDLFRSMPVDAAGRPFFNGARHISIFFFRPFAPRMSCRQCSRSYIELTTSLLFIRHSDSVYLNWWAAPARRMDLLLSFSRACISQ